jgi:hypothetical protein
VPTSAQWLVFLGPAALVAVTPGPGILYVLAGSMRGGRREGVRDSRRWRIRQRVAGGVTMIGLGGFVAATD